MGADEGDREVVTHLCPPLYTTHTTHTHRIGRRIWMTMLEGHHSDGAPACIRCWWVAAEEMMSQGRQPAQTVRYMALAGLERSVMLVMIIHSWSPHMEVLTTQSVKFHLDSDSA